MSVNFNRAPSKLVTDNRYYKCLSVYESDPYYNEGWSVYYNYRVGYKKPNKNLYFYKRRMYRTWKYNRKTQYKLKS